MIGVVILLIIPFSINAHLPGYVGCYRRRSDDGYIQKSMIPNGAIFCMPFCLYSGYRYAGLLKDHCFCMKRILKSPLMCSYPCEKNFEEICGGYYGSMSTYDTWQFNITTSTTTMESLPTSANVPETASVTNITLSLTSMTVTSSVSRQQTGTEHQNAVTIYVPIACGVIVIGIVITVLVVIYRRRKNKAGGDNNETLDNVEYVNQTANDGGHLYSNETVATTAGEHYMHAELQTNDFTIYENDDSVAKPCTGIYTSLDIDNSTSQTYEQLVHA